MKEENDGWESTKGTGNTWNPTKDAEGDAKTEAAEDDYLDGYYVSKKEGQGQHNANVYGIQKKDGETVNVWGTTALNNEMDKRSIGQFIRIKWLGKIPTKSGALKPANKRSSTDMFHSWEVFVNNKIAPLGTNESSKEAVGKVMSAEGLDDLPFN